MGRGDRIRFLTAAGLRGVDISGYPMNLTPPSLSHNQPVYAFPFNRLGQVVRTKFGQRNNADPHRHRQTP